MEVTDDMWEAARENFHKDLPETVGLALEKRDAIKELLLTWDQVSATERKEKSHGNHVYWHGKYMVAMTGEDPRLCFKIEDTSEDDLTKLQFVSCKEEFFDNIKAVHIASECRSDSNPFHAFL
jgi:hypothetical protein